ncbi:MAG: MerR family transcriptional regulator [Burkholderiaceae bacterium]
MYIGEIAKRTGASAKAIRHYEALGLLGKIMRTGSYRVYFDSEVRQIALIKQAQALGFRLSELRPLLVGRSYQPDWLALAQKIGLKRTGIQEEIQRLHRLDMQLAQTKREILECVGNGDGSAPDQDQCVPSVKSDEAQSASLPDLALSAEK